VDIPAMRANFGKAAATGDEAPLYFYSHLFLSHPETRQLFPVSMAHQRDRLFAALGEVVARVDDLDSLVPILQGLGRDHRWSTSTTSGPPSSRRTGPRPTRSSPRS
jgi:hemoglobin-like flavoprotein